MGAEPPLFRLLSRVFEAKVVKVMSPFVASRLRVMLLRKLSESLTLDSSMDISSMCSLNLNRFATDHEIWFGFLSATIDGCSLNSKSFKMKLSFLPLKNVC